MRRNALKNLLLPLMKDWSEAVAEKIRARFDVLKVKFFIVPTVPTICKFNVFAVLTNLFP